MTFAEHLLELRFRFLLSCLAVFLGALVGHLYNKAIIAILLAPLGQRELFFLSPMDPLLFILKVDLTAGVIAALPVINWSILSFVRPAMTKSSWVTFTLTFATMCVLLLGGLTYAYLVVMPLTIRFLLSIEVEGIQNMISASSYLHFLLMQAALIALVFQIPLFVIGGAWIGALTPAALASKRRYVYVAGLIILAIITPTIDLFSLGTVALPAAMIYEGSLLAARLLLRRRSANVNSASPV